MLAHLSGQSMRWPLILTAVIGFPACVHADTVIFKHGTRLECKVDGLTPEGWKVLLGNEDKASIVLDPKTIETVLYDYDSRLDAIEELETVSGQPLHLKHYELGVWCEENAVYDRNMYDRALNQYLRTRGKEGIPDEVYLRLARMYEMCREPDLAQALAAYREYLKRDPNSIEASAAIERLTPVVAKAAAATKTLPGPVDRNEGLEVKPWTWERWSNKATVSGVQESGNKTRVLQIDFKGGTKDKAAFSHALRQDLTKKKALLMDVYNPGKKPLRLAVAVVTGPGYEWYESRVDPAPPETWSLGLRFDFTRNTHWKSKKTNWVYRTKPADLNNVRSLTILIYNGHTTGKCFIDAIRFEDRE